MNAGFGLLRFFLAFNVVLFHLWNAVAPGAGPVAVLGFFFISGFLITQIVQETYTAADKAWAFLLNRFLRIYPQYLAALGLALAAIHANPEVAAHINSYMRWPASATEWAPQFDLFGLSGSAVRILPATWTLGTELYFYLLIGLATGRSKAASVAFCLAALPVGALCAYGVLPFPFYGHPIGNGFVFALGSVAYFYRDSLRVGTPVFVVACIAYVAHLYAVPALEQADLDSANLAGSVLPFAAILLYFFHHDIAHAATARAAAALGRMAYPVFLLHWCVCIVMSAWLFQGQASDDLQGIRSAGAYFAVMLTAVLVAAGLFYALIDLPVERWRHAIRSRARPATA